MEIGNRERKVVVILSERSESKDLPAETIGFLLGEGLPPPQTTEIPVIARSAATQQ